MSHIDRSIENSYPECEGPLHDLKHLFKWAPVAEKIFYSYVYTFPTMTNVL